MPRLFFALLLVLPGCVGAVWQDEETGKTETRVYTPLDLLSDEEGEDEATE